MRGFPDKDAMSILRSYGVSYAVIHEEVYGTADYREIDRIERSPSLHLVHTATDGRFEGRIYRVLRQAHPARSPTACAIGQAGGSRLGHQRPGTCTSITGRPCEGPTC